MIEFAINGERFRRELAGMEANLYSFELQRVFVATARGVAAVIRSNAPRLSGRLRKSVIVQGAKPSTVARRGPTAAALINLRRKSGTSAPHAHLIEGGTKAFAGRFFFAKSVAMAGAPALAKAAAATERILLAGLGQGR